jgi:putative copper export protein
VLAVRADPGDANVIVADLVPADTGAYRVAWHVVSADGHAISGNYIFHVRAPLDSQTPDATAQPAPPPSPAGPPAAADDGLAELPPLPILPAVLRALTAFFVLASAGVLMFQAWLLPPVPLLRLQVRTTTLAWGAVLLSLAHAFVWASYATGGGDTSAIRTALLSTAGRPEILRLALTMLALLALLLTRRARVAAVLAAAAVIVSATSGHAAAMSPALLIPLKALHLAAAALWLGGLFMLFGTEKESDPERRPAMVQLALRVSAVALSAVVLIAITGVLQTVILTGVAAVFTSAYGLLSLAKAGTLALLVGMGALNKFRHLPALQRGEAMYGLRVVAGYEIIIIIFACVIAGFLAYTSPPEPDIAAGPVAPEVTLSPR